MLVVSLAGISISLYAFVAASANIEDYRTMLAATMTKIAMGEKDYNRLAQIAEMLKTRHTDIQRLQGIAVDRKRPLKFIETIEQIGRVTNTKVALSINQGEKDVAFLFFGATLEGTEKNMRTMLTLIQALPYQINIETMTLQQDASTSSIIRIVLTLRVATQ